ncbi:hypothetical protein VTK73DRAFT_5203 [Phialemonium thermophilum]|uniref:Xylanolytic transcriptional activator regulatory domain-containing protein n=1 Tax=Phialemonium thermophilum TaxID=223376 RepID=A0ABR3V3R5_9PEZI
MFAVAALFSHRLTAPESEATAETFFAQAQELCDLDTLAYDSLATVQALLLMGHYLHIRRVTRCWYVFGLAIRIAQGLGLHSPDVNRRYGAVERETRKRCWCACLVMDSMLGMTFGRPMMIPAECYQNADLPAPVDDVLDGPAPAPTAHETHPPSSTGLPTSTTGAGKTPKILVFLCRVKLCVVLQGILRSLSTTTRRRTTRPP